MTNLDKSPLEAATLTFWSMSRQWNGKPAPGKKVSVEGAIAFTNMVLNAPEMHKKTLRLRCTALRDGVVHGNRVPPKTNANLSA